jgi:hypothetical protein
MVAFAEFGCSHLCGLALQLVLSETPLLTHDWISIEENLYVSMREHFRADIAAFHHHTASLPHFLLAGDHPFPHLGMNGDPRCCFSDIGFANTRGDVAAIE